MKIPGSTMRMVKTLVTCITVALAFQAPAWANLIINPTFASNITSDPNAAAIEGTINSAISIYEADFSDPISVNITFQEGGGLGSSSTAFGTATYANYLALLTADAKTADDATALAHLPTATQYLNMYGTNIINIKTANARAVGFITGPVTDGTITLNTSLTTSGSPGSTNQFSLLAVTEHEIDEVLGLGSDLGSSIPGPFTEDLYRYDSTGHRSFTPNSSANAFFSIDGTTDLAQFDNQNDGGDFGDWQSNPFPPGVQPKVQDAFATAGATPVLGVELRALDVIGYDLVAPVPEPSTGILFVSALALLGGLAKLRIF